METGVRKGRRADPQKDEAILVAAMSLFLERGYGVTIDDIAAAAGVSKQTIYARYAAKHDILAAVVREVAQDLVSTLMPGGAAPAALFRFGERFVDVVFDPRRMAMQRLIIAQASQFPDLARLYYESGPAFVRASLAAYIESEAKAGRFAVRNADQAAAQFLGLILGADHMPALMGLLGPKNENDRRTLVRAAVDAFVKLYGAR